MMNISSRFLKHVVGFTIQTCHYSASSSCQPIKKVGFIGLGKMGSHMSRHLINKGYDVLLFDVDEQAVKGAAANGGRVFNNKHALAEEAECIVTMLPNGNDVKNLYLADDGIIKYIKEGSVVIDSSTVDPKTPQDLAPVFKDRGIMFIDAPVSGGVFGADQGTLTFMVGGEAEVLARAKPVLESMGSYIVHCGPIGMGEVAKICNNMLLGISMSALSEVLHMGSKLGLDPKLMVDIINRSTGRSWSSEVNNPVPGAKETAPSAREYEPGFSSKLICKDLNIATSVAARNQIPIQYGKLTTQLYDEICKTQMANKDFSVIYQFLKSRYQA